MEGCKLSLVQPISSGAGSDAGGHGISRGSGPKRVVISTFAVIFCVFGILGLAGSVENYLLPWVASLSKDPRSTHPTTWMDATELFLTILVITPLPIGIALLRLAWRTPTSQKAEESPE